MTTRMMVFPFVLYFLEIIFRAKRGLVTMLLKPEMLDGQSNGCSELNLIVFFFLVIKLEVL